MILDTTRSSKKSSEAGPETRIGRVSGSRLSNQRASSVRGPSVWAIEPSLPKPAGPSAVSSDSAQGSRQVTRLLRLSTATHPAVAGGLADQSQTDVPALHRGKPDDAYEETATTPKRGSAPGSSLCDGPGSVLGHGFRGRCSCRRPSIPVLDDSRSLFP